jgi:hypothetical protein
MTQLPLIHGLDASGIVPIVADSLGYLRIKDAKGNPRGWMYTRYAKSYSNLNLAAGQNDINDAALGAGFARSMKWASFIYIGTVATVHIQLRLYTPGSTILLDDKYALTSGYCYSYNINIPMIAGDYMGIRIYNATLNDDGYLYVVGEDSYD